MKYAHTHFIFITYDIEYEILIINFDVSEHIQGTGMN